MNYSAMKKLIISLFLLWVIPANAQDFHDVDKSHLEQLRQTGKTKLTIKEQHRTIVREIKVCAICKGTVRCTICHGNKMFWGNICMGCNGSGRFCIYCDHTGYEDSKTYYDINGQQYLYVVNGKIVWVREEE